MPAGGVGSMEANISTPPYKSEEMLHVFAVYIVLFIIPTVLLSVTFVLGVLGNGLVIWVAGFRMAHTVTTICYLNLAFADFSFSVALPFLIVSGAMGGRWPFGWFLCKFINIMMGINQYGSIFLIAVIALDRCICVLYPVWIQNHRSVSLAKKVIIGPWILAVIFSLPACIFSNTRNDQGNVYCFETFEALGSTKEEQIKALNAIMLPMGIVQFIIGFCMPMSTMFICYGLIAAKIHGIGMMKSSRSFWVLTAVVASFFICWFPIQLIFLLLKVWFKEHEIYQDKIKVLLLLLPLTASLACFNSCLNPILYVFVGRDFRERLIRSLPLTLERALREDFVQTIDTATNLGAPPAEGAVTAM
ncbi:PREDICTED: N-formyl peptide receptor 2-like isoform X2 [Chinchilla lanigera]|uniref:N-formyl peptide receptor 2-like n=2 Tax=Chinchilla lanigera TaxID=34839 RepID=A0A8C2YJ97_CHILA|nr:PREDICTED: N-formyl peptide receptor 2-like isoform X2 [Chinchilla lanigera]XP_013364323.1 PREDICTED: N-formyl peptide receptor 2-like isoform X2 [Chinchilla lanigera]